MACTKASLAPCLELAIEGERLCRAGKIRNGITCFHSALSSGTDDLRCLSAIYCQLGNAYFCQQDYTEALEYHRWDLTLAKLTGDSLGEAQACGNLGNTLKMLWKFDEAIMCFNRQLDVGKQLENKHLEARALYNLGNVYHTKGKQWARTNSQSDPGGLPSESIEAQRMAVDYYTQNLNLVRELGDRPAEGRVYGNLGNAHYLLGNFHEAIECHKQRLNFANEFGDVSAQRRAYSNLGNACIFLADFHSASLFYRHALRLAQQLNDPALEAQACYSLGNTHTLLRDPKKAVVYHLRHLVIARRLGDRVGEGRAHWSLTNAYTALGCFDWGLRCARRHRLIARELGDDTGLMTAQLMIREIHHLMSTTKEESCSLSREKSMVSESPNFLQSTFPRSARPADTQEDSVRIDINAQQAGENESEGIDDELDADLERQLEATAPDVLDSVELVTVSEDGKTTAVRLGFLDFPDTVNTNLMNEVKRNEMNNFYSNIPQFCHRRTLSLERTSSTDVEDQLESIGSISTNRQTTVRSTMEPTASTTSVPGDDEHFEDPQELFFSLLLASQSRRMDEQRCCLRPSYANNDATAQDPPNHSRDEQQPDEALFDLIAGVQGDRMDDQRATLPAFPGLRPGPGLQLLESASVNNAHNVMVTSTESGASDGLAEPPMSSTNLSTGTTREPDDEFLDMILRLQATTRINDQRSNLPDPLCRVTHGDNAVHLNGHSDALTSNCLSTETPASRPGGTPSCTVPDEDFFALIQRVQSTRLDEQRCNPPISPTPSAETDAVPGSNKSSTRRRRGSWRRDK